MVLFGRIVAYDMCYAFTHKAQQQRFPYPRKVRHLLPLQPLPDRLPWTLPDLYLTNHVLGILNNLAM